MYMCSLDLDKWINEPPDEEDDKKNDINFFLGPSSSSSSKYGDSNPVNRCRMLNPGWLADQYISYVTECEQG